MNKNFSTKLKTSTTFPTRCVCKFCFSGPMFYYFYKNDKLYKSPENCFKNKRICTINYKYSDNTIECRNVDLQEHNFILKINKFNIKMHRTKGVTNSNNYEEVLYCECSKTSWTFNYKSTKNRKEISMRHSRIYFDKDFTC